MTLSLTFPSVENHNRCLDWLKTKEFDDIWNRAFLYNETNSSILIFVDPKHEEIGEELKRRIREFDGFLTVMEI